MFNPKKTPEIVSGLANITPTHEGGKSFNSFNYNVWATARNNFQAQGRKKTVSQESLPHQARKRSQNSNIAEMLLLPGSN